MHWEGEKFECKFKYLKGFNSSSSPSPLLYEVPVKMQLGLHICVIRVAIVDIADPNLFILASSILHDTGAQFGLDPVSSADTLVIAGEKCYRGDDGILRPSRLDWRAMAFQEDDGQLEMVERMGDATSEYEAPLDGHPPTVPFTAPTSRGEASVHSLETGEDWIYTKVNFIGYDKHPLLRA